MLKKISLFLVTMILCSSLYASVSVAKESKRFVPVITYAPATESLVNGIPQNQLVSPMLLIGSPEFVSYSQGSQFHINFFKLIAYSYVDNRYSSSSFNLELSITRSEQQGSEWSGSVEFNGNIKAGILGQIGAKVSGGVKETRSSNEAVGSKGSMTVPAYKQGKIEAYYGGITSSGQLNYRQVDTGSTSGYRYFTTPISCKVHKNYLDVNYLPSTW